jgi:hypothetical protein
MAHRCFAPKPPARRTNIQVICINVHQWISDNSATIAALFPLKEHQAEEQFQLSDERTDQKNF